MRLQQVIRAAELAILHHDWARATCRVERAKRMTRDARRRAKLDLVARMTARRIGA